MGKEKAMEYETKATTYRREKDDTKSLTNIKREGLILIGIFLAGLLIGRVGIFLNVSNEKGMAPFGIAYLLAIIIKKDEKKILACILGTSIGYSSIMSSMGSGYANILSMVIIVIYALISGRFNIRIREYIMFILLMISYISYSFLFDKLNFENSLVIAVINTILILPVYCIVKYGVKRIQEFNNYYQCTIEDILCVDILICLIVSGIGNLNIMGVSIRSVLAYLVIIVLAFVGGATHGAVVGIVMGIIVGLGSGDIMVSVACYSIIGLITGVFKEIGKIFTFLAYVICYAGLALYSQNLSAISIIQATLAGAIFLVISKNFLNVIAFEINDDKKKEQSNEIELNDVKDEFTEKVKNLGAALLIVSNTLKSIGGNQNLMCKSKSSGLIENLTDRVCSNCSRSILCWEKDFNITYTSFERLIKSCEDRRIVFPHQLEKVCINKFQLIKSADSLVTNMNNSEIMKERLEEGRLLVAEHIKNVSLSIKDMLSGFKKNVVLYGEMERILRKRLSKKSINPKKIFCYRDINGRVRIKLTLNSCEGASYCGKNIMPIINDVLGNAMIICDEGCKIDASNNECSISIEESPKFSAISYASIAAKDGEIYTGDTFNFGKANDKYMAIISDGMGSGPEAGKESYATVEVIEKYLEAGFESEVAINMVNTIMSMKFEEEEKFSTLDLSTIDLYSGEATFIKVGAVASFIKRGKKIRKVISNMPPFGLIDNIEVDKVTMKVKNGDLIIMISDGITDINKDSVGNYSWVEEYLETATKDPKKLAEDILEKAKELASGKVKDDMTVLVSKVFSIY